MSAGRHAQPGLITVILASLLIASGCSSGGETDQAETAREPAVEAPSEQSAPTTTDAAPASEPDAESGSGSMSEPADEPVDEPAEEPDEAADDSMAPVDEPATDATADTPSPSADPPPSPDPSPDPSPAPAPDASAPDPPAEGELVTVADTKPGLTRIGVTRCKMCHKLQHASWVESAHAERTPPLDCESCHGSGSEYWKKSIMEDPELARAAGLVTPDATFCRRCHVDDWQDEMMERAHAHEEDDG